MKKNSHQKNRRDAAVIKRFQELLRSGKDYNVNAMYNEAGDVGFITGNAARKIINDHYNKIITHDMISYYNSLSCSNKAKRKEFAKEFSLCIRESLLIARYIKKKKIK